MVFFRAWQSFWRVNWWNAVKFEWMDNIEKIHCLITDADCQHFWRVTDDCRMVNLANGHLGVVFARGKVQLWAFFFEAN